MSQVGLRPLEVTLPCCPTCSRVGKMPGDVYAGKTWCVGRTTERHKRVQMQPRKFVEAVIGGANGTRGEAP